MVPTKVVFMGSKPIGYECFAYLLSQKEILNVEITGVLTQARKEFGEGHDIAALASQNNIPVITSLANVPECDILYSVQYHQILKAGDIARAKQGAINLHMAPLPEYRGSNQFSFAIMEGKEEFGTTIHLMDARIDHGDILFQKRFPVPAGCWVKDLYDLTFDASVALFKETLADIIDGNYTPTPQQQLETILGTSLHYRAEAGAIKQIDLNWDCDKIEKHIRATSMPGFEPPYCIINGEKVYFTRHYS